MFQRTAPTKDELIAALARDYQAATQRHAEALSERAALLAQPLNTKEVVGIYKAIIERARARFSAELERRIGEILQPGFDLEDTSMMGASDPIKIIGVRGPDIPWNDAMLVVNADAVLAHVEAAAKAMGGDQSRHTFKSRQAALAKLEASINEYESAANRALSQWRAQTGQLYGFPA